MSSCDVTLKNRLGMTALDLACEFGRVNVVQAILKHQALGYVDPKKCNHMESCAMFLAAKNGHLDILKFTFIIIMLFEM